MAGWIDDSDLLDFLSPIVKPWYDSLIKPEETQKTVLEGLVRTYAKTGYGSAHGASDVKNIDDFQRSFPVIGYEGLSPYLAKVREGDCQALLPEPVVRWVMTRGTTGCSKVIPATETHLSHILLLGARGIVNFAIRKKDLEVLKGCVLNLNFPSEVSTLRTSKGEEHYGYSSGTYARLNPTLGRTGLLPRQEEIDALGGGITNKDWEKRFELVYQRSKDEQVKSVMGVTPVITAFARYIKKRHNILPKDLWKMKAMFCTSVPKIQVDYAPYMRRLYGDAAMVEMYTATEGVFAQQLDDHPYVSPNYDTYLFEVSTRRGIKPLYGLKSGEWGRLIVSGPLFPRYDIGDLIESVGKGYFRVFGRASGKVILEHYIFNIFTGRIFRA